MWMCRCDCGAEHEVAYGNLRSGHTHSCGCTRHEAATTHGRTGTAEYRAWLSMRARCGNPKNLHFADYGGRGIRVCDRWSASFEAFLSHVGRRPSPMHTIDRIDVNGNYEPGNVRWATPIEQANNTTRNAHVTYRGRTATIAEWARRFGIKYATLSGRLQRGWSIERALECPTTKFKPKRFMA